MITAEDILNAPDWIWYEEVTNELGQTVHRPVIEQALVAEYCEGDCAFARDASGQWYQPVMTSKGLCKRPCF